MTSPPGGSRFAWIALVCGVFGLSACEEVKWTGDAQRPSARIDTVGGVAHVWNEANGLWRAGEGWEVREFLRIGSISGSDEATFSSALVTAVPGPEGGVFVLDYNAGRITEFDAQGRYVHHFGRLGEGPKEFRSPTGMVFDPEGALWVAEGFRARYSKWTPEGELLATHPRPMVAILARQQPLHWTPGGALLDAAPWRRDRDPSDIAVLHFSPSSNRADTIWAVARPFRATTSMVVPPGSGLTQVARHYLERMAWTPGPDGTLWVAPTGGARLIQFGPSGDTLRVVHVAHRARGLTDSEDQMVERALREVGASRSDFRIIPEVVQSIRTTGDGHLLVFSTSDPTEDASIVDVFDPNGVFLGTLPLPWRIPALGVATVHGDTLTTPITGPLDVTYVAQAVFERPPGR